MDRQTIYAGQIPLEVDLLNTNKNTMVALAKLSAAMLGTATVVNGLACVPTSPASLTVNINPGEMYSLVATDATAYSSLSADAHTILKQGIVLDAVNLSCPAPGTAGQSVNFLIQATYQDSDAGSVVLPYYNASNPSQAWSGPGNTGTAQPTVRKGIVTLSAKAGIAATTGSQATPAPDAGYTGLWVVTVANGQTQITAPNIVQAANAPILPTDLLHAIQANSLVTAVDTGSANTYVADFSPAITALTDGMVLWFKAKTANTGASTLNVNGLGASALISDGHTVLRGGEIVANGRCQAVWRADITSWVLVDSTGGTMNSGRLLRTTVYTKPAGTQLVSVDGGTPTSTGAGTFTAMAATKFVEVEVQGGGGGGGGVPATGATTVAASGSGGEGSYARSRFTSGFSGVTVTVGVAGAGGAAGQNAGGNGGTSSFGALVSAPGGVAGQSTAAAAPPVSRGGSTPATPPSGGNLESRTGGSGGGTLSNSGSTGLSVPGASSKFGGGGVNGAAANGPGAGGGGNNQVFSAAAAPGGDGGQGIVIVREYA
ncbi:glycine-rich domain-containing protein [Cupriavidus necator]